MPSIELAGLSTPADPLEQEWPNTSNTPLDGSSVGSTAPVATESNNYSDADSPKDIVDRYAAYYRDKIYLDELRGSDPTVKALDRIINAAAEGPPGQNEPRKARIDSLAEGYLQRWRNEASAEQPDAPPTASQPASEPVTVPNSQPEPIILTTETEPLKRGFVATAARLVACHHALARFHMGLHRRQDRQQYMTPEDLQAQTRRAVIISAAAAAVFATVAFMSARKGLPPIATIVPAPPRSPAQSAEQLQG